MASLKHNIPLIDLDTSELSGAVGDGHYWNANNPVLTHVFNSLIVVDWYAIEFSLHVVSKVLQTEGAMNDEVRVRLYAFQQQMLLSQNHALDHVQMLLNQGYSDKVRPLFARYTEIDERKDMTLNEAVALLNAYNWVSNTVCSYLLGESRFLSMAALKPATMFSWRMVMDAIHKHTSHLVCEQLGVSRKQRVRALWIVNFRVRRAFNAQLFHMLGKDGVFGCSSISRTLSELFQLFIAPFSGYEWRAARTSWLFIKYGGDPNKIRHGKIIKAFLHNYRPYIRQINPEVNNVHFLSGAYFNLDD